MFGEEAARVDEQLGSFSKQAGRARSELIGFSSSFQDLLVPLGFARDEAADLSVAMTTLAIDVGSFANRADADVVRDFNAALVGSSETVLKYGAVLKEANVTQEAYDTGIANVGEALTDQQKVLARISLLYKSTTDSQGDAIRTSESWSNQMKALNAQINEAKTILGGKLITALQAVIKELGGVEGLSRGVEVGFQFAAITALGLVRTGAQLVKIFSRVGTQLGLGESSMDNFANAISGVSKFTTNFVSTLIFMAEQSVLASRASQVRRRWGSRNSATGSTSGSRRSISFWMG